MTMPAYSPVLGLVTGGLEVLAGVYTLSGPGRRTVLRPVAGILFLLAGYQFAEKDSSRDREGAPTRC